MDYTETRNQLNNRIRRSNYYLSAICREPAWPMYGNINRINNILNLINKF